MGRNFRQMRPLPENLGPGIRDAKGRRLAVGSPLWLAALKKLGEKMEAEHKEQRR